MNIDLNLIITIGLGVIAGNIITRILNHVMSPLISILTPFKGDPSYYKRYTSGAKYKNGEGSGTGM